MKRALVAGTSAAALLTSWSAGATAAEFSYTGSVVDYTIPHTAEYDIVAAGAAGGTNFGTAGIAGAVMGGEVLLTAGTVIQIAVGGVGGGSPGSFNFGAGGGGGGSFVIGPGNNVLAIAGGGGGYSGRSGRGASPANTGVDGSAGGGGLDGSSAGTVGSNGLGGTGSSGGFWPGGGGGAGFSGSGSSGDNGGGGGYDFAGGLGGASGSSGGGAGGFGGGGGGGFGGGGGGGYSGGAGGGAYSGGGGGGSYLVNTAIDRVETVGNYAAGYVEITPAPEPASMALLVTGLAGVGLLRRRRRG